VLRMGNAPGVVRDAESKAHVSVPGRERRLGITDAECRTQPTELLMVFDSEKA